MELESLSHKMLLTQAVILFSCSLRVLAQPSPNRPECELCTPLKVSGVPVHPSCFNAIYVLGDSLEDTGNAASAAPPVLPAPYGITNPGCPKGRFSDGAILVDFIAQAYGLRTTSPILPCPCGTNFAIGGATVLSVEFYQERNISFFPVSFDNETKLFQEYRSECRSLFAKSLFIVGGGGNDYTAQILAGRNISEVIGTVDLVVNKVVNLVRMLSKVGKAVLVLNIPQPSCTPLLKETLVDPEGLNRFGCLKGYGRVVELHNNRLQQALFQEPGGKNIAIASRQAFLYDVLIDPSTYGFVSTDAACCGGGGGLRSRIQCGTPNSTVCEEPNKSVYFDYVHFSESFNRQEAQAFIRSKKYITTINNRQMSLFDLCTP